MNEDTEHTVSRIKKRLDILQSVYPERNISLAHAVRKTDTRSSRLYKTSKKEILIESSKLRTSTRKSQTSKKSIASLNENLEPLVAIGQGKQKTSLLLTGDGEYKHNTTPETVKKQADINIQEKPFLPADKEYIRRDNKLRLSPLKQPDLKKLEESSLPQTLFTQQKIVERKELVLSNEKKSSYIQHMHSEPLAASTSAPNASQQINNEQNITESSNKLSQDKIQPSMQSLESNLQENLELQTKIKHQNENFKAIISNQSQNSKPKETPKISNSEIKKLKNKKLEPIVKTPPSVKEKNKKNNIIPQTSKVSGNQSSADNGSSSGSPLRPKK